jgi:hypothetical protein
MKDLGIFFGALLVAGLVWAAAADKPYPVFTPSNFVSTMQLLGPNFAAVNAELASGDFASAKAHLVRSRELMAISITFWRDRKKEDAIKILRDTLKKFDDLDNALSIDQIDPSAVTAIAKQIGAGCQSCHVLYREQDPATKSYRFRKGLDQ